MINPAPLRILHTESSMELGGQEFRILAEAVGMRGRGHFVVLAVQPHSQIAVQARAAGIPVELVRMGCGRILPLVSQFQRIIETYRIDVVNTHGSLDSWVASVAARWSSVKPAIVRTRHKSTPIVRSWRHYILYRMLPHAVVTTGEAIRTHLIRDHGIHPDHVVSIPTGVDVSLFSPNQALSIRMDHEATPSDFVVGTVSFLRDYKGLNILIAAAQQVVAVYPHVKFWIIGEGPERSQLEQMITEFGLQHHVVLCGFQTEIPRWLSRVDVFVMPSTGAEGIPQALTQALAMERPVVASSVGGIPEVVEHGITGLLVPPNDPDSLAKALLLLLRDSVLRKTLGRAGRQRVVEELSMTRMLEKTEELYYRLLEVRGTESSRTPPAITMTSMGD
ncbi:MAG: glycosyltransferase family 1 protein [Nitrospirae bacterium]|nr:MAG: glycosyltransferase family 1 protein [Nitrospirota bacterium]